jgi:enoyl-CoA hydratase
MTDEPTLITRKDGRIGRILMNRPKALNALDSNMIQGSLRALKEWANDPHVHAVVIEGAGDRAFCAGGDVRALREWQTTGNRHLADQFFTEEYELNLLINNYPKPYIALIDGICMGGGIGMAVHGSYRVATENADFGMPETVIGFFPDIGGTYLLPRLPGELGIYLGLTGLRIKGTDSVHAGFGTHFVPRANLPALSAALAEDGLPALARFAQALPEFSLAQHRSTIDHCFSAPTMLEIVARLEADGSDWAKAALNGLRAVSPIALCFTLEALRRGANLTLSDALDAEFALTKTTMAYPDFAEGVRAMVVDKDRAPKWQPARLEDVDQAVVAAMFAR